MTDNIPYTRLETMSYATNIVLINFTHIIEEVPFEKPKVRNANRKIYSRGKYPLFTF